ncbi:Pycsar system effector family protein [Chromobacterium sp. Panama]|uniref:Pycsar system effector family protein n=1 Tax=Chromobacterium sp. Panama TaxID=2161826 RepID=UPI0011B272F4|nr:Pycsar system effector family protein [Chromobacterium sp. Panama]
MADKGRDVTDTKQRLATAQWVFERHLAWIAAAEVKVGVIVTINMALLGGLAAAFTTSDSTTRVAWTYLFTLTAAGAAVIGLCCAAVAVLPRTNGPKDSLLFFGPIAAQGSTSFGDRFRQVTDEQLLTDWTDQIHRNAEIAQKKYIWVRRSMLWSFFAATLWIVAIGLLVKL